MHYHCGTFALPKRYVCTTVAASAEMVNGSGQRAGTVGFFRARPSQRREDAPDSAIPVNRIFTGLRFTQNQSHRA